MYLSTYCQISTQTKTLKPNQTLFHSTYLNLAAITLIKKRVKCFNDFQNENFSVLWLKWTHAIRIKQSQTFLHETYSNLTSYLFLSKNIRVFQWLSKSKFLNSVTKVNTNNGNETKSDILSWDIFKSDILFHWSQNTKIFQWLL